MTGSGSIRFADWCELVRSRGRYGHTLRCDADAMLMRCRRDVDAMSMRRDASTACRWWYSDGGLGRWPGQVEEAWSRRPGRGGPVEEEAWTRLAEAQQAADSSAVEESRNIVNANLSGIPAVAVLGFGDFGYQAESGWR
ncbi:hypothetical protein SAMD00023353_2300450 [Rosellinia necatrix]|uniref:Uncharacterized protein n=1 Tax=Rosellinia necatrix TaxID=77044 RepID=A0A1S8A8B8_ROSNE|nr:hypothetical protein SAMD00023353_2300450 [Rosellinia necatrix]